jgi:hypothetical protein
LTDSISRGTPKLSAAATSVSEMDSVGFCRDAKSGSHSHSESESGGLGEERGTKLVHVRVVVGKCWKSLVQETMAISCSKSRSFYNPVGLIAKQFHLQALH